jgi:hypothetical protein
VKPIRYVFHHTNRCISVGLMSEQVHAALLSTGEMTQRAMGPLLFVVPCTTIELLMEQRCVLHNALGLFRCGADA